MTAVDGSVYMAAADIAARDGVTRQAVSKQVARLIAQHALDVRRDHNGRVVAINVVDYDRHLKRFGDSAQVRPASRTSARPDAPATPAPLVDESDTLDGMRRQKLVQETELLRLEAGERKGRLVRHDAMVEAAQRLAEEIGRALDLVGHADTLAAAMQREGLHGLRRELKALEHRMRVNVADHCQALAIAAPRHDPLLTETDLA